MSAESKNSIAGTALLVCLGVLALCSSISWLAVLVPAATFVYYGTAASLFRNRRISSRSTSRR